MNDLFFECYCQHGYAEYSLENFKSYFKNWKVLFLNTKSHN